MEILSSKYNPKMFEKKWYQFWEEKGFFHAKANSSKKTYSILMPPPNITGILHMGHALNLTLADILIRWKRMQNYNVLWLPGTDHAGIATQNVVKQKLISQGINPSDLEKEEFIKKVWEWKEKHEKIIIQQLKKLGASCDWQRKRFTLDKGLSLAVKKVFVKLFQEKLIYQADYIVNWCPECKTSLSDIEVEHKEITTYLYYIKYPFKKNRNEGLIIATTRPETMLGDTAVAINPKDNRFNKYIGEILLLPLINRELKIIGDEYVDMNFGTGILKITPAHDINDFNIGLKHNLPLLNIFNKDATLNEIAEKYKNQDRFECRNNLLQELEEKGYFIKKEKYISSIGHCYRCHTIIEPLLSKQWFVKTKELANLALKVVKEKKIKLIPQMWEKTYYEWLENIKDWCISRQLWWGHQIPVWYCLKCKEFYVEENAPIFCQKCGSKELKQDEDVLDTWFSSALWPFSTLGWPEYTQDLKTFYPSSTLITGFDIIFFWVARMIMMGIKFMNDVPFYEVYFHALVRDFKGKKMSKSFGNVIDPLEMMKKYGTDAFRFTLTALTVQGRDIILSEKRIEGYRNFCNKIWNAARFVLINLNEYKEIPENKLNLELVDFWIISRYQETIKSVTYNLEKYHFDLAAKNLYEFIWHEFCDWYIELTKLRLYENASSGKSTVQYLLVKILSGILKLLHPFMPFITEEIWQKLPLKSEESILISSWPEYNEKEINNQVINQMNLIIEIITAIRNICGEINIPPSSEIKIILSVEHKEEEELLKTYSYYIKNLVKTCEIIIGKNLPKPKKSATNIVKGINIYIPLENLIDFTKEKQRLNKEITKIDQWIDILNKKLKNQNFITYAPKEMVKEEKNKKEKLIKTKEKLVKNLEDLKE